MIPPFRPDRCATCLFWQRGGSMISAAARDPAATDDVGSCNVRSPFVAPSIHFPVGVFPQTHANRFCGDYEPRDEDDGDDGEREPQPDGNVVELRSAA